MKHLALYLCAPMQSWGATSKFGDRSTLDAPTRSGLLGMLAAACGVDKNDATAVHAWLTKAAAHSLDVYAFRRGDRLTDYHTVGARYERDNPWRRRMIPTTADGKPRGTDITHRDYLTDTVFGAVLSGDDTFLEEIATKLSNPVWGVWFGRKCCIPTEPVLTGRYDSRNEAKAALEARLHATLERTGRETTGNAPIFAVIEASADDADETLLDVPVSFARREFHARRIRRDIQGQEET